LSPSEAVQSSVRFLALERDFAELAGQYREAQDSVFRSGVVVGGPWVERLERSIATLCGRKFGIATTSGTEALRLALVSAGIGPGWQIVIPALSYIATAGSVLATGAVPIVIDVDDHGHLELAQLETVLSQVNGPIAVVAVGLFGDGLRDDALTSLCTARGAVLIEDAAQSFGARHQVRAGGGLGLAASLSFAPTKTLPCFGNAGMVVTDEPDIATRARLIRAHGKANNQSGSVIVGVNGTLSASHAAQLCVSLEHYERRAQMRESIADKLIAALRDLTQFTPPPQREHCKHNWHKFVVQSNHRDALMLFLRERGIECQVHYPIPLCDEPILEERAFSACVRARTFSRSVLSLPMHPFLTDAEIDWIAQSMRMFHEKFHA
jgi:dTDP-4-amino-4,6-dideoxygalactose transaminase